MSKLKSVLLPLLLLLCILSTIKIANMNHRIAALELRVSKIEKETKQLERRSKHNSKMIIYLLRNR